METINEGRVVNTFLSLAAIDSPSYGERLMADELTRRLQALGLEVEEDSAGEALGGNAGNLIVRFPGDLDLPPLLFCAHMDTVEPAKGKNPILRQDGTITSAGDTVLGADDLAGVACILEAVTSILEKKLSHRPLELVFPVAEEPYTVGSHQLEISRLKAKEAYVLDSGGVPGGVVLQAPTILYFKAIFRGKAAHAGQCPEKGVHAIQAAARAVAMTQNGHVDDVTTVNIGTIHGGKGINIVPDTCVVEGEVRSFCHQSALERFDLIAADFRKAAKEQMAELELHSEVRTVAYQVQEQSPIVQRLERVCQQAGLTKHTVVTFGGSDGNTFNEKGITSVVLSSAMHNVHTCQEYTTVAELTQVAQQTLALMLDRT